MICCADRLPLLPFGERAAAASRDVTAFREELATVIPGLLDCGVLQGEAFRFKAAHVNVNGMSIGTSANSPMYGRVAEMPWPILQLVTCGRSAFFYEGKTFELGPGMMAYLPENERLGECPTRSLLTLAIDRKRLREAYQAVAGRPIDGAGEIRLSAFHPIPRSTQSARVVEELLAVSRMIDISMQDPAALHAMGIDDTLYRLIAMAIWPEIWSGEQRSRGQGAAAKLRLMQDYVRSNIHRPVQLTALALRADTSVRNVRHIFLQELGVGPVEWIRNERLEHARKILERDPHIRIRDVAADLGFARASTFAEHYRARFGETPAATRARCL